VLRGFDGTESTLPTGVVACVAVVGAAEKVASATGGASGAGAGAGTAAASCASGRRVKAQALGAGMAAGAVGWSTMMSMSSLASLGTRLMATDVAGLAVGNGPCGLSLCSL
jgi:hypothetical protein